MGASRKVSVVLVLLVLAALGYYISLSDGSGDPSGALEPGLAAEMQVGDGAGELPGTATAELPTVAPDDSERAEVQDAAALELEEGPLVRGQAQFSFPVPVDEQLFVVAMNEECSRRTLYRAREDNPLGLVSDVWIELEEGAEASKKKSDEDELPELLSFAPVAADGSFELRLPVGTELAHLALAGRYIYSHGTREFAFGEESPAPILTGELGAWVRGKLTMPLGLAEELSPLGAEIAMSLDVTAGFSPNVVESMAYTLKALADAEGHFELRAVHSEYTHLIYASFEGLAGHLEFGVHPGAGERLDLELRLQRGATLRGEVFDQFMKPVREGTVIAALPGPLGRSVGELRTGAIMEDGSFTIENVLTGRVINLTAVADGYKNQSLKLEEKLRDGQFLDGLLIEVNAGKALAGRVSFPDGTPAAGAKISLSPDFAGVDAMSIGQVAQAFRGGKTVCEEDGTFELLGLEDGPFTLHAKYEEDGDEAHTGAWAESQAGLEGGETDIQIELRGFVGFPGVLVTETEVPLGAFEVRMVLNGSGGMMGIGAEKLRQVLEAPDEEGHFRVTEARSGTWSVSVKPEGFALSETQDVVIPLPEGTPAPVFTVLPSSSISGVVYDQTGSPVSGALVTLDLDMEGMMNERVNGGTPKAHSDHEGKFILEELTPGTLSVHATLAGYAPSEALPQELAPGERLEDLQLTLRVGATIAGVVFGEDGDPSPGRTVILQRLPAYNFQQLTETDRNGEFRSEHMAPGQWQIVAMANLMNGDLDPSGEGGMGDMLNNMVMEVVTVVDGDDVYVTLGSPPEDPVELLGHVSCDGEPVAAAVVSLRSATGENLGDMLMTTTDESGNFSKTLSGGGDYLVTVQTGTAMGQQNSVEFFREVPLEVISHRMNIEMPLGGIAGRVLDHSGAPVEGCRVTLHVGDGVAYGSLLGGHYTELATDSEGNYSIEYLDPGTYNIAVGGVAMGGMMGSAGALGRENRQGLKVQEGQWLRGIDFKLSPAVALSGLVRGTDGSPVAGAAIFVRDEHGVLVDRFGFVVTDGSGKFNYTGLAEGAYRVSASKDDLVSAVSDAVSVGGDSQEQVEVQLAAGCMLLVSVVDQTGSELRPTVSVRDESGEEWAGVLSIGQLMAELSKGFSSKEQRVGPLPQGKYRVVATLPDGRTARKNVKVKGQAERKVRIKLK